jgi:hypothetical protein
MVPRILGVEHDWSALLTPSFGDQSGMIETLSLVYELVLMNVVLISRCWLLNEMTD